jgi:DNA-binding transcriptional LysR family regulator
LSFVAVVPKSLAPNRGSPTLRDVLGGLPFAAHTSDGQFTQKLRDVARGLKTELRPALICQSFPQSLAGVRSGGFASVLPALALKDLAAGSYHEIPGGALGNLNRAIVLAWNARLPRVRPGAKKLIERLQAELRF